MSGSVNDKQTQTKIIKKIEFYVGIDVSKNTLDIAVVADGSLRHEEQIANEEKAVTRFFKELAKTLKISFSEMIVCMEHTGIYNYKALTALHTLGIRVCVEPALQIKQSQGMTRGKNDSIDAHRIAQYAYKNRPALRFWKPERIALQKLKSLLTYRNRLIRIKSELEVPVRELAGFTDQKIEKKLRSINAAPVKVIMPTLRKVDQSILELIKSDEKLNHQHALITSITGIGTQTASQMILSSGEFETIPDAKKFACYSGVAPFEHSSGTSIRGKTRVSKLANLTMKKLLHLAALSAAHSNGELQDYYQRKVNEGKNKMSVLNAVRNKLISRAYRCIKDNRPYEKIYQNALA